MVFSIKKTKKNKKTTNWEHNATVASVTHFGRKDRNARYTCHSKTADAEKQCLVPSAPRLISEINRKPPVLKGRPSFSMSGTNIFTLTYFYIEFT